MVVETHERYGPRGREGELDDFARYARQIVRIQERNRRKQGAARAERALHAKSGLGVDNAEFIVHDDLPAVLRQGCYQPGARLRATVRLSNGSGMHQPDGVKDLRGIAVRLFGAGHVHDLLMTNFEPPHAANAAEFMAVAMALAGRSSSAAKLISLVVRLPPRVGVFAAGRIIVNVLTSGRRVGSLATETYWSRGAILWGDAGPVRYLLRPLQKDAPSPADGDDALRNELLARLRRGSVEFELLVQRYVSDTVTPVENVSTPWRVEREWPIGRLHIPQQDLDTAEARLIERRVELLAFNPWNTPNEFRPLGNLNRARRFVYEASAAHRNGQLFEVDQRPIQRACDAVAASVFGFLNRTLRIPWYRMPTRLGLLNLAMLRRRLRKHNLIDTTPRPKRVEVREPTPQPSAAQLLERDPSGRYNDLSSPEMGAIGAPFGRNMRIDREQSDTPDPRDVSRVLLARDRFIPARSLNMLAAAWIQFQVHDWAKHEKYLLRERSIDLPARPNLGEGVMRIAADRGDGNEVTHWWDGSEVYGTPGATDLRPLRPDTTALRLDKSADLALDEDGCLPRDPKSGLPRTNFDEAWWLGLSVLQTLMTKEHNAVCAALRDEYRNLSEDRIYQIARLVVTALTAKIHTVEWTPAILDSKTVEAGMNILWNGAPADRLTALGIRLLEPGQLRGTAGSVPYHHGVPFALTEEFITVYRMHQLIPDDFAFVDHRTREFKGGATLPEVLGKDGEIALRKYGLRNVVYSFGISNPGAVTLHNFPRYLRTFTTPEGNEIDLAAVDVLRTRTRGVPLYNDFREQLHMPRRRRFEQVTKDQRSLDELKELYDSVDEIDTVVGLLAETPPPGFGFSDTAFRVFLLMASRRLQSDRFLTVDFRPEVYTPLGMDWIRVNSFSSVLLRHFPELADVVPGGKAVFGPWR